MALRYRYVVETERGPLSFTCPEPMSLDEIDRELPNLFVKPAKALYISGCQTEQRRGTCSNCYPNECDGWCA